MVEGKTRRLQKLCWKIIRFTESSYQHITPKPTGLWNADTMQLLILCRNTAARTLRNGSNTSRLRFGPTGSPCDEPRDTLHLNCCTDVIAYYRLISLPSWSVVDWEGEVTDRESLLVARMRQLDQRSLYEAQASTNLKNSQLSNKSDFDASKRMRAAAQQLRVGDLVLLHNMILSILIHVNLTTSGTALFESARFPKIRLFIDWKSWMAPHSLLLSLEPSQTVLYTNRTGCALGGNA